MFKAADFEALEIFYKQTQPNVVASFDMRGVLLNAQYYTTSVSFLSLC